MRKWLIGIVAAVVLGGGLYYGLAIYPTRLLRASLDQTLHNLPPGLSGSYAAAHYSLIARRATVNGVTLHRDDPNGFDLAVTEIDVTRPATDAAAAWTRAAADPANVSPDLMLVLGDEITAKTATYRDATTSATLGSLRVARPRVYPWSLLKPDVPSLTAARESFLARPPVAPGVTPSFSDYLPLLRAEAAMMLAFGYDGYNTESLAGTMGMPATANVPAMTLSYTVQKMESTSTDRGDTAGGMADGLTVRSDHFGSVAIAHLAIEGVTMRGALTQLVAATTPTTAMLDGVALKRVAYGPISLQPPAGAPIALGTVSLTNIAFSRGLLVSGDLAFEGLHIGRSQVPNPQLLDFFDKLGIDGMTLGFGLGYRWDLDQRRLSIRDTTLKIAELGTLTLALDIDGAGSAQELITKARLTHATLRYEDASLVDRALKLVAQQRGADPAALRQQLIATAAQIGAAPDASAATQASAQAVHDFLDTPHALQIDLAPSEPIPLLTLLAAWAMPPDKLVPRLGISIMANK